MSWALKKLPAIREVGCRAGHHHYSWWRYCLSTPTITQVLRGSSASGIHHGQAWSILVLIWLGHEFLFLLPPCPRGMDYLLIFREWPLHRFRNRDDQFIHTGCISNRTRRRITVSPGWVALGGAFRWQSENTVALLGFLYTWSGDFISRIVFDLIGSIMVPAGTLI